MADATPREIFLASIDATKASAQAFIDACNQTPDASVQELLLELSAKLSAVSHGVAFLYQLTSQVSHAALEHPEHKVSVEITWE